LRPDCFGQYLKHSVAKLPPIAVCRAKKRDIISLDIFPPSGSRRSHNSGREIILPNEAGANLSSQLQSATSKHAFNDPVIVTRLFHSRPPSSFFFIREKQEGVNSATTLNILSFAKRKRRQVLSAACCSLPYGARRLKLGNRLVAFRQNTNGGVKAVVAQRCKETLGVNANLATGGLELIPLLGLDAEYPNNCLVWTRLMVHHVTLLPTRGIPINTPFGFIRQGCIESQLVYNGNVMIKIDKVSKTYFDQRVVENLSITVKDGSIFGFLGPNGAGKTTTMKMIVGLSKPDAGTIEIGDNRMDDIKSREIIGYMPEDPYFYDHLNALELLGFMAALFSKGAQNKEAGTPKRLESLLSTVGLKEVGKKKIKDYSKGMKQRLGLAQALVNDPRYIFLDEPLDGLDPIGRLEFKRILLSLKNEGKTIFFNSHVLSDVEEICDTIGIINKGKLIYSGPVKKFAGHSTLEKQFVEVVLKDK